MWIIVLAGQFLVVNSTNVINMREIYEICGVMQQAHGKMLLWSGETEM